ncbi:hypothetical protein RIF29_29495 [Crotalaria pallida]|uniref:FBD domain-containing protein n=1 Tax=Crotalaria pallida TaxID=3830 RepID=A0AAN9EEU9_CROPI
MFSSYIDNWISLAIKMECEKIDLELKFATLDDDDEPYNFPCHLLLSSKNSHLKHLFLYECQFNPTHEIAERLVTLKSIALVLVLMEANILDLILSSCLNLEFLELIDCQVLTSLRICRQDLGLKHLDVISMHVEANIELSIPNLEIFRFFGSLEDITFSRMNKLKSVDLDIDRTYHKGFCQLLDELSENAHSLEELFLCCHFPQYLCYPHNKNYTPKFDNLTHLELTAEEDYGWNMFTYMLYKSPQLKHLVIDKGYTPSIVGEPSWIRPELVPTCVSSCLEEVTFIQFNGQDCELEFVGYILKNASILKKMEINITIPNSEVRCRIANQINTFPRSSKACEVSFDT